MDKDMQQGEMWSVAQNCPVIQVLCLCAAYTCINVLSSISRTCPAHE